MIENDVNRIANALEKLALIQSAARFIFKITIGELMPNYKADRPDFDFRVSINATDSEGNVIPDSPIPTGHALTLTSDNPVAFTVTQDAADPRLVHAHVGSPGQSSVVANLTNPAGLLVATGAALVNVTVGDPALIQDINVNLPE
jgi:hypothetical protein